MKILNHFRLFFLVIFAPAILTGQSSIVFDVGTHIDVSAGADICADIITINGTYSGTGTVCFGSVIPVELFSFVATVNGTAISLIWETASESNNAGFSVERQSNNSSFIEVSFIAGFGTSTEKHSYSFVDSNLAAGSYVYRLKQVDFNGEYSYSELVNAEIEIPLSLELFQNHPNPFNPQTNISYTLNTASVVKLVIYNYLGEEIVNLVNAEQPAGKYTVNWSPSSNLSSGTYIYRLQVNETAISKKMIFLK